MKIRQAKKILSQCILDGRHNDYWGDRLIAILGIFNSVILRERHGDHRLRKAIVVYERRKRKNLRR